MLLFLLCAWTFDWKHSNNLIYNQAQPVFHHAASPVLDFPFQAIMIIIMNLLLQCRHIFAFLWGSRVIPKPKTAIWTTSSDCRGLQLSTENKCTLRRCGFTATTNFCRNKSHRVWISERVVFDSARKIPSFSHPNLNLKGRSCGNPSFSQSFMWKQWSHSSTPVKPVAAAWPGQVTTSHRTPGMEIWVHKNNLRAQHKTFCTSFPNSSNLTLQS